MNFWFKPIMLVIVCSFSACRYEDGPLISFRQPEKRIEGTYEVAKFEVGGADSTAQLKSQACYAPMLFGWPEKSGTLGSYAGICITGGTWFLNDKKDKINIRFEGGLYGIGPWGVTNVFPPQTITWDITRLKDDEMDFSTTYNGINYKIKLCE